MKQLTYFEDLGLRSYKDIWDYQEILMKQNTDLKLNEETRSNTINRLLFVEHPPVYTLGKSGDISHVLIGEEEIGRAHV